MILLSSILAAHAAPALRKVCLEAQVSYEDVGVDGAEEDYFQTNANRPLRGAKLFYKKSADPTYTAVFVDHGSDAGCVWLTVDDAVPYDLKIAILARVNDHDISVVQSQSGLPWEATWSSQSFASGVTKVLTVGPNRAWNVLAASGFALHRRDGGLANTYDPTFHLTNNAGVLDAPSCGNMSCVVGTDIYLTDDLANRKFPTVYAMGITFLNHEGLTSGVVDESADNTTCGPSSSAVALQSLEHDSAAAVAGYAWFYAATVFNHTTEGDCGLTSWIEADWDMLGGVCFDEVESPADHAFSCADGPPLVPRRNQLQYCRDRHQGNDPAAYRSVPLDWLRFLWELQSSGAENFADITSAYAVALPSWTATGSGVQTAFGDTGGLLDVYATLAAEHGGDAMRPLALSLLGALVAFPARATCPPTAGYGATTRPTLTLRYLNDIGFWDDESCTLLDESCAYGVVTPSSSVDRKDSLFVFLPGLGGIPLNHRHIANMAGYAGYRAIFPLWDNELSVGQVCAGTTGLVGGTCPTDDDDDCQRIVRNELLTGRDDLSSDAYSPPHRLASISHRLGLALNREAELDTSNTWDWGQYCEPDPDHGTAIHWDDVVLAGHSFGGNQAAYIAYRTPTQGTFVIDSGYDTCESEPPDPMNLTYDIYDDDLSDYNTTGEATLWYSTFTRATTDWVFALHDQDIFPSVVRPALPKSMEFYVPGAVDDTTGEPEGEAWFDIDADADTGDTGFQQGTWAGERFIATSQAAASGCAASLPPHASMASDACMPDSNGGAPNPLTDDETATLALFQPYVAAFCALGD